jgi:hypothetical protein
MAPPLGAGPLQSLVVHQSGYAGAGPSELQEQGRRHEGNGAQQLDERAPSYRARENAARLQAAFSSIFEDRNQLLSLDSILIP